MKISIITPTHKGSPYLKETWGSVKNQTYQDWEWVLCPSKESLKVCQEIAKEDKRIKVIPQPEGLSKIGEVKKFAFSQGQGEWLLELDHDDLLLPAALEELSKVSSDFAYSNTADFRNENWESPKYNPAYGWQYREIEYQGHKLNEAISWKPSPQSISLIYYAPNHFRAWKKSFYEKVGGHNPELNVCDDHELLIRTYLAGEMYHIDKCLYLYRIYGGNAWLERNAEIQTKTYELYNQYIYPLVERWCDLNGLRKIDLCGGFNKPQGYESIDLERGDIKADLNDKWPLEDNSVGVIRAWDALEHLKDKQHTMKEIHRVLAPNGWLLSLTPSTDGRGAFQDPTHCSFWNQNSFYYYIKAEQAQYIDNKDMRFQVSDLKTFFPNDWNKNNNIAYIQANLIKLGEQMPGLIEI